MKAVAYMHIRAAGDTPEEVEADALERAKEFFGETPLEIYEDYQVFETHGNMAFIDMDHKKLGAMVPVSPIVMDEEEMKTKYKSTIVNADGDTDEEIEADAIRKAREIFGENAVLKAEDTFTVSKVGIADRSHPKKYYSYLTVYLISKGSQ